MDDPDDYDPFHPHPLSPDPSSPPLIRNANSVPGPSTSPTKRTSKSLSSETIKTEKKGGGSSHGGTQVNDSPEKVEEERKNGRPGKRVKLSPNTETQSQDVQSALNQLLSSGLTLPRIIQLSAIPDPPPAFEPICESTTLEQCRKVRSACPYPHMEPIIRPWTEPSLGHCSYLNLCYGEQLFAKNPSLAGGKPPGNKQCRYLHFRVVAPALNAPPLPPPPRLPIIPAEVKKSILRGPGGEVEDKLEGQWLDADVRELDCEMLGQFNLILMDPPWDIHMSLPYGTLSDEDCRSIPIPLLQPTYGLLAIWVTGRAMELGRELISLWGYRRIDEIVWIKVNQLGGLVRTGRTGHWLNHTCEHLLIALKLPPPSEFPDRNAPIPWETDERLKYMRRGQDGDVMVAEVRETSRKPDEMYGVLERMVPFGRKLGEGIKGGPWRSASLIDLLPYTEMFGRKHNVRPGWLTIGNQLGDNHIVEPELKARFEAKLANPADRSAELHGGSFEAVIAS